VPRRLTIPTRERGKLPVLLIYNYGGTWEPEWRPLQGHPFAALLTEVSHDTIEHAVMGYSRPFVKALGRSPLECLHKLPSRECVKRAGCPLYDEKNCLSTAKAMPWCFEPEGTAGDVRRLGAELVRLWREGVYVVVVEEPADAG
jgi:hypothetical protein